MTGCLSFSGLNVTLPAPKKPQEGGPPCLSLRGLSSILWGRGIPSLGCGACGLPPGVTLKGSWAVSYKDSYHMISNSTPGAKPEGKVTWSPARTVTIRVPRGKRPASGQPGGLENSGISVHQKTRSTERNPLLTHTTWAGLRNITPRKRSQASENSTVRSYL